MLFPVQASSVDRGLSPRCVGSHYGILPSTAHKLTREESWKLSPKEIAHAAGATNFHATSAPHSCDPTKTPDPYPCGTGCCIEDVEICMNNQCYAPRG
jgi:hypothetical protein